MMSWIILYYVALLSLVTGANHKFLQTFSQSVTVSRVTGGDTNHYIIDNRSSGDSQSRSRVAQL